MPTGPIIVSRHGGRRFNSAEQGKKFDSLSVKKKDIYSRINAALYACGCGVLIQCLYSVGMYVCMQYLYCIDRDTDMYV